MDSAAASTKNESMLHMITRGCTATCFLLVGLSLSIGWGIRGNFGHEYGAMIPGALATLAAVLLSGREDWYRRSAYFAFFGALGWSFGGSMSYMQVIGYTHSGHSLSVAYGFASLYLLGFLWAVVGGAAAALVAVLEEKQITEIFPPLIAVFVAWVLEDVVLAIWFSENSDFRHRSPLYWYDTDWLAALLAMVAVLGLALVRRRADWASKLFLHMAIGWWAGFLLLVNVLGLRMTPPRGDNWAGMVGMVAGMLVYFHRLGFRDVTIAALLTGFVGGFGFATAQMFKLLGLNTGVQTNWHSLLEQSYGFINGLGAALGLLWLARRSPKLQTSPGSRHWTYAFSAAFVLLGITYLNLSKNPEEWVSVKAVPSILGGLAAATWFTLAYVALTAAFVYLLLAHRRKPLALLSLSPLGKGQLLYLVLLWWVVIGNFERALVSFAPVRLVTEVPIFFNAVLCTVGILACACNSLPLEETGRPQRQWNISTVTVPGICVAMVTVLANWSITRAVYGDTQAPGASKHIRFGPNATATTKKPATGAIHP